MVRPDFASASHAERMLVVRKDDRMLVVRKDDRVALHVFDHSPGEIKRLPLFVARLRFGDDLGPLQFVHRLIGLLNQDSTVDSTPLMLGPVDPVRIKSQEPPVLLLLQKLQCIGFERRCKQDLGEDLIHFLRQGEIHRTIAHDDAPER